MLRESAAFCATLVKLSTACVKRLTMAPMVERCVFNVVRAVSKLAIASVAPAAVATDAPDKPPSVVAVGVARVALVMAMLAMVTDMVCVVFAPTWKVN